MASFFLLLAALAGSDCFEAVRALDEGSAIAAEDLVAVPCDSGRLPARVRYDGAARVVLLMEALPAGGYLGRLAAPGARQVAKGDSLTLRSAAGPVVIERSVVALQPGRSGERIFVRDADGAVFAVALELSAAASAQ